MKEMRTMTTMEVDIGEVFGKKITSITWAGDDMCVIRLEGMKLLVYIKDGKLLLEAIKE
jgi:hypothetical protein